MIQPSIAHKTHLRRLLQDQPNTKLRGSPPPYIGDWGISRAEIGRLGNFEIGIIEAGTYMYREHNMLVLDEPATGRKFFNTCKP